MVCGCYKTSFCTHAGATNAITGCRTILTTKKEQACTPNVNAAAQTGFAAGFLSLEWFILLISLICLAIVYLFTRSKQQGK